MEGCLLHETHLGPVCFALFKSSPIPHLSLVICCVCVYSPCILVSRCVLVIVCYVVCFVFFLVFPVISDFSLLFNLLVFSTHCLYDDFSIAYAYLDLLACSWTAYLCTESCLVKR